MENGGYGAQRPESHFPFSNFHSSDSNSPLICISTPAHSFLNSTFANVPRFLRREDRPVMRIHPDDASLRDIGDGDRVRVANELGEVFLGAEVTDAIMVGTVLAPGIWWHRFSADGRNINQVTGQDEADMGAGATFYDVAVWVEKAAGAPLKAERKIAEDVTG